MFLCTINIIAVPVYGVKLRDISSDQHKNGITNITFDLIINVNEPGSHVTGRGMWKVGVWASANANGTGTNMSFTEQVKS